MCKPTKTELFFLAATLTAATLTTLEVTPKVMKLVGKQSAMRYAPRPCYVQAEIKKKKLIHPNDAFSMGLIIGAGAGVFGTIKLIASKINGYP